jgi:hypothetical protein
MGKVEVSVANEETCPGGIFRSKIEISPIQATHIHISTAQIKGTVRSRHQEVEFLTSIPMPLILNREVVEKEEFIFNVKLPNVCLPSYSSSTFSISYYCVVEVYYTPLLCDRVAKLFSIPYRNVEWKNVYHVIGREMCRLGRGNDDALSAIVETLRNIKIDVNRAACELKRVGFYGYVNDTIVDYKSKMKNNLYVEDNCVMYEDNNTGRRYRIQSKEREICEIYVNGSIKLKYKTNVINTQVKVVRGEISLIDNEKYETEVLNENIYSDLCIYRNIRALDLEGCFGFKCSYFILEFYMVCDFDGFAVKIPNII